MMEKNEPINVPYIIPMPEGVDVTQGDVMHQRDIPADVDIPVMMI